VKSFKPSVQATEDYDLDDRHDMRPSTRQFVDA